MADEAAIAGGIEHFTITRADGTSEDGQQCARCGSSVVWVDCWNCDADGFTDHDCGEDTCCCLDPEPNRVCDVCEGESGYSVCASGRAWCEANPMPGREGIPTTARDHDDE